MGCSDAGQPAAPVQRGRWTEERNTLAGKLLDHMLDVEASIGNLPCDDVDGAMAVRLANVVLAAGWEPGGTATRCQVADWHARNKPDRTSRADSNSHPQGGDTDARTR